MCDRCEKEIQHTDRKGGVVEGGVLFELSISRGRHSDAEAPTEVRADLCEDCYREITMALRAAGVKRSYAAA